MILIIKQIFVSLTNENSILIWGANNKLIELYEELKTKLVNIHDIVVTDNCIGILKKDNSIIFITIFYNCITHEIDITYEIIISKHKYIEIISTNDEIYGLSDNSKVYLIKDNIPIEILTNIKEIYSNLLDIIGISYDNIIFAYLQRNKHLYYKQQILDLKLIKINKLNFIIIKNNNTI